MLTDDDSMAVTKRATPRFRTPPVVEVVLGVQFDPLPGFRNAHLGAFWKSLGPDWPEVIDAPPLPPQFERFGETQTWAQAGARLTLTQGVDLRLQMKNSSKNRMIQVQNGRLHFNWLGHEGGEYPAYSQIRPAFQRTVAEFLEFLESESLDAPTPNQWEVTYLNHIPKGTVWESPSDWADLFPSLPMPRKSPSLVLLESFGGEWHYEIPPHGGRLHVQARHGSTSPGEGAEILLLNLTTRGPVSTWGALEDGLDVGHNALVHAFKELTSSRAHAHWELMHDDS